jgi:hypothetical protein
MKDAYNVGLNYLMDKYPKFVSIRDGIKSIYCENIIDDGDIDITDRAIAIHLRDYYLAISCKKDLEVSLTRKGIIFEKRFGD